MIIPGHATPDGAQAVADAYPAMPYAPLADTGLLVSRVGFRAAQFGSPEAGRALLKQALAQGVNLVDATEIEVEIERGREGVVLVGKAGYVRGETYAWAAARKEAGRPFPNLVKFSQDTDHCIHPDFLDAFLTRTLERLNLAALDGFLLHDPELYLQWADRVGITLREAQRTFYIRLKLAFEHLEQEAAARRIQFYGVSSSALTLRRDHPAFISLNAILESGSYPHFKVVELPLNLLETGAVSQANQPNGIDSVLDMAAKAGLAVLVKRPFSSQQEERLIRLTNVPPPDYPATPQDVSTAVDTLIDLESEFRADILPALALDAEAQVDLQNKLRVGHLLQGKWGGFAGYWNWLDVRSYFILPEAQSAVRLLQNTAKPPFTLPGWLNAYIQAVNELLAALTAFYQERAQRELKQIHETAMACDPDWQGESVVETAVRALLSTTPVTSLMPDAPQPAELNLILSALNSAPAPGPRREAWKRLGRGGQWTVNRELSNP